MLGGFCFLSGVEFSNLLVISFLFHWHIYSTAYKSNMMRRPDTSRKFEVWTYHIFIRNLDDVSVIYGFSLKRVRYDFRLSLINFHNSNPIRLNISVVEESMLSCGNITRNDKLQLQKTNTFEHFGKIWHNVGASVIFHVLSSPRVGVSCPIFNKIFPWLIDYKSN